MRVELLPAALVGGLALFVAVQSFGGSSAAAARESAVEVPGLPAHSADGDRAGAPEISSSERRNMLLDHSANTYLTRVIADGEHVLTRWRTDETVRVWVSPASSLRGWHPRMVAAAREAFDDWRGVVPVNFHFVADSLGAQVVVSWRDSFQADAQGGGLVGHARRHYTPAGWIAAAEVALAVHAVDGSALSSELIRVAALHEVGHVLGLPHSDMAEDIMAPSHKGEVSHLSLRDVRTAQELYRMVPGGIR